jgi:hypothetical protein
MALEASFKSDLQHIDAIVATLERIARSGDCIASTSVINDPGYWRWRIEVLLGRQDLPDADRKHAYAVMERLHGLGSVPGERR